MPPSSINPENSELGGFLAHDRNVTCELITEVVARCDSRFFELPPCAFLVGPPWTVRYDGYGQSEWKPCKGSGRQAVIGLVIIAIRARLSYKPHKEGEAHAGNVWSASSAHVDRYCDRGFRDRGLRLDDRWLLSEWFENRMAAWAIDRRSS